MRSVRKSALGVVVALIAALGPMAVGAHAVSSNASGAGSVGAAHSSAAVCPAAQPGTARCHARVVTDGGGTPVSATVPQGFGPSDLRTAYNLLYSSVTGTKTVAIVDAYDDPYAESDLATYRSTYHLPECTTKIGCFRKVNQNGGTKAPRPSSGWAQEISLDLDMVSAVCPDCHILLVEATSNSYVNLGTAVNFAATQGVVAISNSYGGGEFSGELSYDNYYNHPGIAITVSSGDNGYGVEYPAASPYVTSVGGTSLTRATWSETAWSGAGSGCSAYEPQPSWQHGTVTATVTGGPPGCDRRSVADVSAVADPNTAVAVYDTYQASGWLGFGGTSVAAPIIAGVYALAGNTGQNTSTNNPHADVPASLAYTSTTSLKDVTSGSNGSCGGSFVCTAGQGYDGPTGLGTPKGTGAF